MDMGFVGLGIVWLISLVPLLVALWALISIIRALNRMADAQEASARTLRLIADDLSGVAKRPA